MCPGVGLLRFILAGTLCFLNLMVFSFTRLGKFSTIISANRFSIPCLYFFPSSPPMMWMLLFSCYLLNLSSCLLNIFLFIVMNGCFFLPCLLFHWYSPKLLLANFRILLSVLYFSMTFLISNISLFIVSTSIFMSV